MPVFLLPIINWFIGSKVGRWLLIGAIVLAGAGVAYLAIFHKGMDAERIKAMTNTLAAARVRVETENEIARTDHVARRERLRRWSK